MHPMLADAIRIGAYDGSRGSSDKHLLDGVS